MKIMLRAPAVLTLVASLQAFGADLAVVPLPRAHAHNDYEHARPLLDALDHGFCSVEADIFLVDGELLVAHNRADVRPERTLQALYLDPLQQRVRANGGSVYANGAGLTLLIDVKSAAEPTYEALKTVLSRYQEMLTRISGAEVKTNAVTVVISGNRAREAVARDRERYAALDGRPEDLSGAAPKELIPLISEDWKRLFTWRGVGEFSAAEEQRLKNLVNRAHGQGRKVRFWGTPDLPEVWQRLLRHEVDFINADDLGGLREFLRGQGGSKGPNQASGTVRAR